MSDQQTQPAPRVQAATTIDASANPTPKFPDGVAPAIDKATVRRSILKQLIEGPTHQAANATAANELHGQDPAAVDPVAETVKSSEQSLTSPGQTESPTGPSNELPIDEGGALLRSAPSHMSELLMQVGASLRRVPGVGACLVLAEKALNYVVLIVRQPREAHRGREGIATDNLLLESQPRDFGPSSQAGFGNTLHLLSDKPVSNSLEASKNLHESIIKASRDLGQAALREDQQEQREELDRRALDEAKAREAAQVVRAIDNLSGSANGETQTIINGLSGPFSLSVEQAISLARDAERRETGRNEQQILSNQQIQLHSHSADTRTNPITDPASAKKSSRAA